MFWSRKQAQDRKERLAGAKGIPGLVGSYMVVHMKKDPDWVWQLRGAVRPVGEKKTFHCRVFHEAQAAQAGVKVKDWTSLDDHPALILWEGYFDEKTNEVRNEKFVREPNFPQ
jgi:hypothetical protein